MSSRASGRPRRPEHRRPRRGLPPWVPVATIGVAAVLLVVAVIAVGELLSGGNTDVPEHTVSSEGRTLGSPDAPVKMIAYFDFQCPYCADFTREVQPQIEEKYIQTGQVSLEMRPMAFVGQESLWAAEAAECANDQGRFLDYHDILFEKQGQENSGAFSIDNLKAFAVELGLDTSAFNTCLDTHKYAEQVRLETNEAGNAGITSTPSFVVGGTKLTGLQSFDGFVRVIDEELKKAS